MNTRLFVAVALLFAIAETASAGPADLADLAPARSLAYLELHDPPALAREFHTLIRGSYLQHPALLFAHNTGAHKNEEALLFSWMASPEFIDELGDWQGGFVALTGLTRKDNPEVVAVLRTGKSRMFPLALRMFLLESGSIRYLARVEGVPIFQIGDADEKTPPELARRLGAPARQLARAWRGPRKPASRYQVAFLEEMPAEEPEVMPESGCFLSLLPGTVAFGTTPEILRDTIRRLKGKSSSPSLATVPAFRAAVELRRPGLFAWSDPLRLTRLINGALHRDLLRRQEIIRQQPANPGEKREAAAKRREAELREAEAAHRRDTQEWTFLQKSSNLAGMRFAAASWSLHKGEFACRLEVRMKEKQTSPLLDLLTNQKPSPDLLRALPGDAFCFFALPLSEGGATLARLLKLADLYVASGGEKMPPISESVAAWEKSLKLKLGRDVLAKIRSAAVAVHLVDRPAKDTARYPVFVVEAVSENAARDLVGLWPRLLPGNEKTKPRRHTIKGQSVFSLTDKEADPFVDGPPPHYGQRGKIIVLGWHRGAVAAILHDSGRAKDLLNLPRGWATVDAEGPVSAMGLFSGRQLLAHFARIGSEQSDQTPEHLRALRYLREMSTPMAAMPPTLFQVKRLTDGMRVEFRQSELPVASATVVDVVLTWMLDVEAIKHFGLQLLSLGSGGPPGGWNAVPAALAALPAPPPPPPPPPNPS